MEDLICGLLRMKTTKLKRILKKSLKEPWWTWELPPLRAVCGVELGLSQGLTQELDSMVAEEKKINPSGYKLTCLEMTTSRSQRCLLWGELMPAVATRGDKSIMFSLKLQRMVKPGKSIMEASGIQQANNLTKMWRLRGESR